MSLALAAFAAAQLARAGPAAEGPQTFLVSIADFELERDQFVSGFAIDTWGVTYITMCHFPPGWEIRAGRDASPTGVLAGEGSHGVTWLGFDRLGELRDLALVSIDGPVTFAAAPVPNGTVPPTFAGHVRVGRYGVDQSEREVALTQANIRMTSASRCPDPGLGD